MSSIPFSCNILTFLVKPSKQNSISFPPSLPSLIHLHLLFPSLSHLSPSSSLLHLFLLLSHFHPSFLSHFPLTSFSSPLSLFLVFPSHIIPPPAGESVSTSHVMRGVGSAVPTPPQRTPHTPLTSTWGGGWGEMSGWCDDGGDMSGWCDVRCGDVKEDVKEGVKEDVSG